MWAEDDRKAALAAAANASSGSNSNGGIQIEMPSAAKRTGGGKYPLTERVRSLIIKIPNPKASATSKVATGSPATSSIKEESSSSPMAIDDTDSTSSGMGPKNDSAIDPSELEERLSSELKNSGLLEESDKVSLFDFLLVS